jgi:hypothetical protein
MLRPILVALVAPAAIASYAWLKSTHYWWVQMLVLQLQLMITRGAPRHTPKYLSGTPPSRMYVL